MVSDNNIEKLLERYDNGETTLQEEQQLRVYFAQNDVAPHLEPYRVMFQYFANTRQEQFTKEVSVKSKKRSYIYQWISIAAIIVAMFGIFTQFSGNQKKTLDDLNPEELLAYNKTKEALNLVSSKFNQGTASFNALSLAADQFDKGVQQVGQIDEFSKTTNKIFKNK
ncbi:MAG: hypothetical protein R2783_06065 [Gelidibacter sp.]